jgi:VanZ family protein
MRMRTARSERWFLAAFVIHACLVVTIAVLAYTGHLPVHRLSASHLDLLGHAVLIGLMGMLLDGALGSRPLLSRLPWLGMGPSIIVAVAGVEEILQVLSSRRSSSISDFVADVAGVVLLTALARLAVRTWRTASR